MKRKTCANCPHLKNNELMRATIFYCGQTEHIVPHASETVGKERHFTFWRIPMTCPLSNNEVQKSKTKIPQSEWVVIKHSLETLNGK